MAAFGILVFHLSGKAWPLNALYIFVDFFFVLSGFVLYSQIPNKISLNKTIVFAKKRLIRLVPTAWLAIVVTYLVYFLFQSLNLIAPSDYLPVSAVSLLFSLLFLQAVLPFCAVLLIPMWSLSTEIIVNSFFSIIGVKKRNVILSAYIAGAILGLAILGGYEANGTSGWIALNRGIYGFSCGLIARELSKKNIGYSKWQIIISGSIAVTIFFLISQSANYIILVSPTMAVSVFTLSKIELTNEPLICLSKLSGKYSYGIYLWHFPVIYFVEILYFKDFGYQNLIASKLLEILIVLLISIILTCMTDKILRVLSLEFKSKV